MKMRRLLSTGDWKSDSSGLAILTIIWSIIAGALTGCSPEGKTQFTVAPPMSQPPTLAIVPTVSQTLTPSIIGDIDQLVNILTRSKWQQVRRLDPSLAPETVTWEFYSNGMFRWQFTSDFSETNVGAWAFEPASEESGVLFLASTMNDLPKFDVLSLQLHSGVLVLGEFSYQETPLTGADVPPSIIEEDRQAVSQQRDNVFSLWITMTVADWQSKSTPAPGDANWYSFMQDGTYSANYDITRCEYSGTWSISFAESSSGLLRLSIPTNECDPRGAQEAFIREIPIRLEGDQLILDEVAYSSIPR